MCGRLVNLDTVARVLAEYYHLKTDTQLAALNDALGRVPAETVGKELFGISEQLNDTISRAAVVDEIDGVDWYHINRNGEMVHGANSAEHQAWYKADDIYAAIERVPSAQPVAKDINVPVKDCISRQAALDALEKIDCSDGVGISSLKCDAVEDAVTAIKVLPSAQRWIPCTPETMPKVREWVLCQCRAGIMDVLRLNEDGDWNKNYPHAEYMGGFVIAWMPLPETWKGEEK